MTAFHVHVAAAKQDVDGLADAVQEAVWSGVDRADSIKFFPDELGTFLPHGAFEVALSLFLRTSRNLRALLAQMKAAGAEVF